MVAGPEFVDISFLRNGPVLGVSFKRETPDRPNRSMGLCHEPSRGSFTGFGLPILMHTHVLSPWFGRLATQRTAADGLLTRSTEDVLRSEAATWTSKIKLVGPVLTDQYPLPSIDRGCKSRWHSPGKHGLHVEVCTIYSETALKICLMSTS